MATASEPHPTADDAARRARIQPGQWLERHGDALYRFALLRLRREDAAAEAVQEALVAALQSMNSYAGASSEATWLTGILKHKIVDQLRRQARSAASLDAESGQEAFFNARGLWKRAPSRWRLDPMEALERRELRQAIERCLGGLPDHLAVPFVLREIDGMPSAEICQVLEITPTNLWARLHRARLRLRDCLEAHGFGEGRKA